MTRRLIDLRSQYSISSVGHDDAGPARGTGLHGLRAPVAVMLLLLGGIVGCTAPEEASLGTVSVNLIGQAPSGAVYRLRHATITVTGNGTTRVWNTEDAPDQTSISEEVDVGNYRVTLAPGWDIERIDGASATPVVAQLLSDNPVLFTVALHQRTTVPLRFHIDTEEVDLAQGYEIVVTVEEPAPQVIVVTNLNNFQTGSITVYAAGADGDVAPLRTIAGPLTTLTSPGGVTVTDDEIVACDASAVDFFPLLADGDVAPTRQIVGLDTRIGACIDVAVVNDEVYVVTLDSILVFPVTANGNVEPSRRVSGFSFAEYLAIDDQELYVSDGGADTVFVFSLPLADEAEPTRSISAQCASGVAVHAGELLVGDVCLAGISGYPATANGSVAPLRTLTGANTGIAAPEQIRRFQGQLYLTELAEDRVLIFPDDATGDVAPLRSIGGPNTGVVTPIGVAVR
jgi:hypothetical protein